MLNVILVERRGIIQLPIPRRKIMILIKRRWDNWVIMQLKNREKATPRPKRPPRGEGRRKRAQHSPRIKVPRHGVAKRRIKRSDDGSPA